MDSQGVFVRVGEQTLRFRNLDKPLFADGTTKGEVLDYYTKISPVFLPHLQDRCLTRLRFPNGASAGGFFEKNPPTGAPEWLRTQSVEGSTGCVDYVVGGDLAGLLYLANLATLEFHTPQWQIPASADLVLLRESGGVLADRLMIDLDPGEGTPPEQVALSALLVAAKLAEYDLIAYPKTSGNKGLQLVAPIEPTEPARVLDFVRSLARDLRASQPAMFTDTIKKDARTGLVLIDYAQNLAGRNTIAPYSLRGLDSPRVSTPLSWAEVSAATQGGALSFGPAQVLERVTENADLWSDVVTGATSQPLSTY